MTWSVTQTSALKEILLPCDGGNFGKGIYGDVCNWAEAVLVPLVNQILMVILVFCTKWVSDLSYLKIIMLLNLASKSQPCSGYLWESASPVRKPNNWFDLPIACSPACQSTSRVAFLGGGCFSGFVWQLPAQQQSLALKDKTIIA